MVFGHSYYLGGQDSVHYYNIAKQELSNRFSGPIWFKEMNLKKYSNEEAEYYLLITQLEWLKAQIVQELSQVVLGWFISVI